MQVSLKRISGSKFEAVNEEGNGTVLDGPEIVGGVKAGVRPMEMVLMGLAGCAGVDVLLILQKGKHRVDTLDIQVDGTRADAVPAVFTDIHIVFEASGDFTEKQLARAADLSLEKYCSVATMLRPGVSITHETKFGGRTALNK